jgi:hypothetical protein
VALDGLEVDRQFFQHGGVDCVEILAKVLPQAGCTGIFFTEAIQKRGEILDRVHDVADTVAASGGNWPPSSP